MLKQCTLILDNLRSVENTASIFRTAEGLGVKKIILVGTTPAPLDRFGRKRQDFAKISLGAEDMIAWQHITQEKLLPTVAHLQEDGHQLIALELTHESKDLKDIKSKKKFMLVVGNEVDGVSKTILELADEIVEIPMQGRKESLNVSVSTGIALYELLQ